ncbi:transcription antitermination protein NusB [Williamsoniiplasma luminosum]|nr:transcription antitermination factor NusB [Williamsoniiplasma luminosum]ATZ17330.1 transcription antitermination protein NusB [Williamsoniiplasma luminosum]
MKEKKETSLITKTNILAHFFYRAFLLRLSNSKMRQEILDEVQISKHNEQIIDDIEEIIANMGELKTIIFEVFTKDWTWERIPALIQALLIVGAYQITMTDEPKALIINEIVNLTKSLEPDFEFGFVNAVLDKINKED